MNNNFINKAIIFGVGAAVGSALTYLYLKRQQPIEYTYDSSENLTEEPKQESVSNADWWSDEDDIEEGTAVDYNNYDEDEYEELSYDPYNDIYVHISNGVRKVVSEEEYFEILNRLENKYDEEMDDYHDSIQDLGYTEEVATEMKRPYVIPPKEFRENGYAIVTLTMYTDGLVANEQNKLVRNVDEIIGEESLTHFGEYEEDSVFVRNDNKKIDYEILKDYRTYEESKE